MRAITFDAGGTLIEPYPSVGHVYATVAASHGLPNLSPTDLTRRFLGAWRNQRNFDYTREGWMQLVDATFAGLAEVPPSQTFFSALYEHFGEPQSWHVFDDVLPALESLRAHGFKLGVISNWDERLRPLLTRLGLTPYFNAVIISCEVGATKPDRRIFERAAEALGCEPGTILHAGDSLEMDVQGARAAGFRAIELRRRGTENQPPGPIDNEANQPHVLTTLRDIATHVLTER